MSVKKSFYSRLLALFSRDGFFYATVGLLVFQSAWIALSSSYPMAFDEDFHFGIIRLYAHHLSPFWSGQPSGTDVFGAVARDPSYLYQWLMSFPLRLITLFTHSQVAQVIILRAINIALFATGLIIFRRVLLRTKASKALINLACFIFVLIPVAPLLAAQINYDNLFLPATALVLLLTLRFDERLRQKKFNLTETILLFSLILLSCLVKYAFLPIAIVLVIYLISRSWPYRRKLRRMALPNKWLSLVLSSVLLLGSFVLFSQRYFVNIVRYHNPVPDCSKVLSVKECNAYGPWIRDYNFKINKIDTDAKPSLVTYVGDWFYGMWLRLFFTVGGPSTLYQSRGPLPLPSISAAVFSLAGVIAFFVALRKRMFKRYNLPALRLLGAVSLIYAATLWLDELSAYIQTDQPVAINGRYLLPVMLPLILMLLIGLAALTRQAFKVRLSVLTIGLVCLIWGGGLLTFILRSNDAWYWKSQPVYDANHAVQHVIGPIMPGNSNAAEFLY